MWVKYRKTKPKYFDDIIFFRLSGADRTEFF